MNINSSRLCPNPNPNVIRLLSNCFPFFRKQSSPPLLLEDLIESRRIEIKNPAFSKRRRREADRSFHSSYVFRVSFVPRVYIDNGWWMLIEINDLTRERESTGELGGSSGGGGNRVGEGECALCGECVGVGVRLPQPRPPLSNEMSGFAIDTRLLSRASLVVDANWQRGCVHSRQLSG